MTPSNIDFELVRGGVVTGKVSDTDGRPIIDQPVALQNVDQNQQRGGFGPSPVAWVVFAPMIASIAHTACPPKKCNHDRRATGSALATVNGQRAYKQTHPDSGDQSQADFRSCGGRRVISTSLSARTIDEYSLLESYWTAAPARCSQSVSH
jgi:hypothetical protein